MALTMDERRYAEIRRGVMKKRLAAKAAEVVSKKGKVAFASVDAFFDFLDSVAQAEAQPTPARRKRR